MDFLQLSYDISMLTLLVKDQIFTYTRFMQDRKVFYHIIGTDDSDLFC